MEGEEKLRDKLKELYEEAGIELQGCVLVLREQEGDVMESQAKVLRWLVDNEHEDLATVHGMKSSAKDMMKHDDQWEEEMSTLLLAAWKGYAPVVRGLVSRGAEINKPRASNGCTPLYIASENGHVDVVRVLVEQGADINKARDDGGTPLFLSLIHI